MNTGLKRLPARVSIVPTADENRCESGSRASMPKTARRWIFLAHRDAVGTFARLGAMGSAMQPAAWPHPRVLFCIEQHCMVLLHGLW